ncbi:hypothetical protein HORIV_19700 [Vreelandella olivaria]|uniref:Uncharacterized protein n=1 Tax=Vreelandella olivaria TaxID=390919 RepID=A0ABM7GGA8_9GAMM|nr:hypothetical protein HORIV_19700 [Halomonas olivaria]
MGEGLVGALRPLVSSGGVGLIAAALILSGFPLFSGMSWLQVADELGKRLCRLGSWCRRVGKHAVCAPLSVRLLKPPRSLRPSPKSLNLMLRRQ